jgi:hypothetical protein
MEHTIGTFRQEDTMAYDSSQVLMTDHSLMEPSNGSNNYDGILLNGGDEVEDPSHGTFTFSEPDTLATATSQPADTNTTSNEVEVAASWSVEYGWREQEQQGAQVQDNQDPTIPTTTTTDTKPLKVNQDSDDTKMPPLEALEGEVEHQQLPGNAYEDAPAAAVAAVAAAAVPCDDLGETQENTDLKRTLATTYSGNQNMDPEEKEGDDKKVPALDILEGDAKRQRLSGNDVAAAVPEDEEESQEFKDWGTLETSRLVYSKGNTRAQINTHIDEIAGLGGAKILTTDFSLSEDGSIEHAQFSNQWVDLPYGQHQSFQYYLKRGDNTNVQTLLLRTDDEPASQQDHHHRAIAIFWFEPQQYNSTKQKWVKKKGKQLLLHYIGHYQCTDYEELSSVMHNGKTIKAALTFSFHHFDDVLKEKLDSLA